uniref:Uncharacterized protein n=1 Tax=Arundo donax TaxID=35708 RepID=A0A0A9DJW9_ARUDO
MNILDTIFKTTSKALHDRCDQYVSWIGGMEDDLIYAWRIAKVLIPGFETEIELAKIAGGLGSKQIDLPEDAVKAIANYDKQAILQCLERLLGIYKYKTNAQQYLNELRLDKMTIEDQIGVTGMAVSSKDDKRLTVVGVRGKDETPAVGREDDKQLSVEAVGNKDGTLLTSDSCNVKNMDRTKKKGSHNDDRSTQPKKAGRKKR